MIRAEELMIGDWVIDTRSNTPLRVNPFLAQLEVPEWKPIPLTPEILEKNEFEKLGYDGWEYKLKKDNKLMYSVLWRCDYPNALRISSYSSIYGDFNSFHIDNVHELQHALKLCRINLEIKV